MESFPRVTDPISFVVFGATGDLFARKIIPSLFLLHKNRKLPATLSIIGFGRQAHTDVSFKAYVAEKLHAAAPNAHENERDAFLALFSYHRGEFDDLSAFQTLGEKLAVRDAACACTTLKSFYLAVPPEQITNLIPNIAAITADKRHIIIEKPFGKNEREARALNQFLRQFFKEDEVFRIDHYLAKPALEALLEVRTTKETYDALLAKERITTITVTLFETTGVEKRGAFYDGVGALKDVGQNHLLEMLALAIMPVPEMDAAHVCHAREAFMATLPRLTEDAVRRGTRRAAYDGYRNIPGVRPESQTETLFQLSFTLTHPRYPRVPVTLQSGKRMKAVKKDIVVSFDCEHTDSLHIELEPTPCIYTKKGTTVSTLATFIDPEPGIQYSNEYASLFLHAWCGNATPFPTEKEVEYMWRFTDPVSELWEQGEPPLLSYPPDTMVSWEL